MKYSEKEYGQPIEILKLVINILFSLVGVGLAYHAITATPTEYNARKQMDLLATGGSASV